MIMNNYEQKYKEALERANQELFGATETSQSTTKELIEFIFPELKESKDEKIRKELIVYFQDLRNGGSIVDFTNDDIIAWLKKQGENSVELSEESEKIRMELINHLQDGADGYEPSGGCEDYARWLAWLQRQGEKRPRWTGKDSSMQFMLMRDIEQVSFLSEEAKTERIMWVNSLDDRFAPNSKPEDDCENVKRCIRMILTDAAEQRFVDFNTNLKECLEWVKSR